MRSRSQTETGPRNRPLIQATVKFQQIEESPYEEKRSPLRRRPEKPKTIQGLMNSLFPSHSVGTLGGSDNRDELMSCKSTRSFFTVEKEKAQQQNMTDLKLRSVLEKHISKKGTKEFGRSNLIITERRSKYRAPLV